MRGWTVVYADEKDEAVVERQPVVLAPMADVSGAVRRGDRVRLWILDEDLRHGYDHVCKGRILEVLGDEWVRVWVDWATLTPEFDWDTHRQPDGTRNHLLFGWRWQYHPARTMNLPWWQWVWDGGTDEFCNPAFWFRLPWCSVAVFYKRPYRTRLDGRCGKCWMDD